tara:strand:- start:828 stop:1139 length:312 start_codon:yes stop_codon:yes gene_type:complete
MAIGNLFDNRNQPKRGSGFQYEWKGDVSFRSEDIEYLYKQLKSGVSEPKMFMSGESKQGKGGPYITVRVREPKESGDQVPQRQAPPPQQPVENDDTSLDDIPF